MLRLLLGSTLVLFACGGQPPVGAVDDNGDPVGDSVDWASAEHGGDPGSGSDPCQLADCNDRLHQRDEYTDPAELRVETVRETQLPSRTK